MEVLNSENTPRSLDYFKDKSFEIHKEFLDQNLKLNKLSTMSTFLHILNFLNLHSSKLDLGIYFYWEKLFYLAIELRLVDLAKTIYHKIENNFRGEPKVIRMSAELAEIDSKPELKNFEAVNSIYKKLIEHNQEDKISLKKYLGFLKTIFNITEMKKYTDLWNEYLKVFMDDYDAWYELSDVYIMTNNFKQAVYCLEEVLLHLPNNYQIYTKIGDLLSSHNNSETSVNAIKYYSQSILIKPTPRAFWGLIYNINIIIKANKNLDEKTKTLLKIAQINLKNFYANSPFKFNLEQFYEFKLE